MLAEAAQDAGPGALSRGQASAGDWPPLGMVIGQDALPQVLAVWPACLVAGPEKHAWGQVAQHLPASQSVPLASGPSLCSLLFLKCEDS